jgi:hypothetical protein
MQDYLQFHLISTNELAQTLLLNDKELANERR